MVNTQNIHTKKTAEVIIILVHSSSGCSHVTPDVLTPRWLRAQDLEIEMRWMKLTRIGVPCEGKDFCFVLTSVLMEAPLTVPGSVRYLLNQLINVRTWVKEVTPFQPLSSSLWVPSHFCRAFYGKEGGWCFQRVIYSCCAEGQWEPYLLMYVNTAQVK